MKSIKKHEAHKNVLLAVYSLLFCLAILLSAEFLCRMFSSVNFLGNSRNLFIKNAYGDSIGNAKNIKAISFGMEVYTDENGFRVPQDTAEVKKKFDSAILILGDSIAFGSGIKEDKTICGLLRENLPSVRIYNSSVIGYCAKDYKNVIDNFLPEHREVKQVYLVFCLNDLSSESAQLIDDALGIQNETPGEAKNSIDLLKQVAIINKINNFLRFRSKLYIIMKSILSDPQYRYWRAEFSKYMAADESIIAEILQPISDISEILKKKVIGFTVIIIPMEFQVRSNDPSVLIPNIKLHKFLESRGINYIDPIKKLKSAGFSSKDLYLLYDPYHLSENGHNLLFNIIYSSCRKN